MGIVKRYAIVVGIVLASAGIGFSVYSVEQHFKATDVRMAELTSQVQQAMQVARSEAADASAASQRAMDAAARSETAALGRTSAEQQRDSAKAAEAHAQAVRAQAEEAAQHATQDATQARSQLEALRKQREEELNQMQAALSKVVDTRRTQNGMIMILPDSTFKFDFDSADLRARNRELLSRVAGILLASKGFSLSVYGYTDDIGSKEYNQKLSERRADAVRNYLVQAGIDSGTVSAKGFGKTNPLVNGESQQARASNRRVEIAVADSEISYTGLAAQ
jgi:outer membrane protein OmpA-like peptidoglycan-associated protein